MSEVVRMQYAVVAGARVSRVGLGCWQFGSRDWGYGREYADDVAIEITHNARPGFRISSGTWPAVTG